MHAVKMPFQNAFGHPILVAARVEDAVHPAAGAVEAVASERVAEHVVGFGRETETHPWLPSCPSEIDRLRPRWRVRENSRSCCRRANRDRRESRSPDRARRRCAHRRTQAHATSCRHQVPPPTPGGCLRRRPAPGRCDRRGAAPRTVSGTFQAMIPFFTSVASAAAAAASRDTDGMAFTAMFGTSVPDDADSTVGRQM